MPHFCHSILAPLCYLWSSQVSACQVYRLTLQIWGGTTFLFIYSYFSSSVISRAIYKKKKKQIWVFLLEKGSKCGHIFMWQERATACRRKKLLWFVGKTILNTELKDLLHDGCTSVCVSSSCFLFPAAQTEKLIWGHLLLSASALRRGCVCPAPIPVQSYTGQDESEGTRAAGCTSLSTLC